jgi:hypothetical protein
MNTELWNENHKRKMKYVSTFAIPVGSHAHPKCTYICCTTSRIRRYRYWLMLTLIHIKGYVLPSMVWAGFSPLIVRLRLWNQKQPLLVSLGRYQNIPKTANTSCGWGGRGGGGSVLIEARTLAHREWCLKRAIKAIAVARCRLAGAQPYNK